MRWLPRSLFSRIALVLLGGLVIAQLLSLAVHMHDRRELLSRASGMQSAQRIADIVKLLDTLDRSERRRIIAVLSAPPLTITMDHEILVGTRGYSDAMRAKFFGAMLRRFIGGERLIEVYVSETPAIATPDAVYEFERPRRGPMGMGAGAGVRYFAPPGLSFVAQVPLLDGTLVTFDTNEPTATASWPYRLLLSLAILMIAVVIVSLVAVRWATRPLNALADAAEALGKNIDHAPLTEKGPVEVVRAARAFNTMQARLQRYISDRTRVLAAMSHDLKTPITRLRLRSELLDDGPLRDKFGGDLQEMESMVSATLDFMRGLENGEPLRPVDIMAILESLQADMREMGESVTIAGMVKQPYPAKPQAFKRCLSNLVDNAIKYGKSAAITVNDHVDRVEIRIRDEGPGIPQSELDKVLEPFYRVETSRNRQTGGTGLGLTIARSIVENHGGRLTLRNHAQGGLELELIWPRSIRTSYATAKPSTPRRR